MSVLSDQPVSVNPGQQPKYTDLKMIKAEPQQ